MDVEVIGIDLAAGADLTPLNDAERARAGRFRFPADRRRYTTARVGLRTVLAARLGVDPADVRFTEGAHGKPALVGSDLQFNVSHSGELALIAVAAVPVGVDVEFHRRLEHDELARRFFSSAEVAALSAVLPAHRAEAFFRCWTRKEAYIKGVGRGLSMSLSSFDVSVEGPARLLRVAGRPGEVTRWSLLDLPVSVGSTGCVAVRADGSRVRLHLTTPASAG